MKSKLQQQTELRKELTDKLRDYQLAVNTGNREMATIYQIEANTLRAKLNRIN
jgi:hypothetical protein